MELSELLTQIPYKVLQGSAKRNVGKVACDTRKIDVGDVFVCIRGHRTDGHTFAGEAVEKGAAALVIQDDLEDVIKKQEMKKLRAGDKFGKVSVIQVADTRRALAVMAAASFGYPADKLKIIGITGTKGKTTTAYMVQKLLNSAGHKAGLIGTVKVDTGKRVLVNMNTTPESADIQFYLKEMANAGCDSAVMEVSSQGLKLGRTEGIFFEAGVFTNLSEDHIGPGEHADFEEYKQCKRQLFQKCKVGIGNIDDPYFEEIFRDTPCRRLTYGLRSSADIMAADPEKMILPDGLGVRYRFMERAVDFTKRPGMGIWDAYRESARVDLPMPGIFNVYNSLAALAVLRLYGVPASLAARGFRGLQVPGRLEPAGDLEDCKIYVDYAHNAASLINVLKMFKEYGAPRLVAVFGCGGNRAGARRFFMGEAAGKYADLSIITTDNPRYEEPLDIIADIERGVQKSGGKYVIVPDRKEAIRYALRKRRSGDVIVIAGKGHEDYQEIRGVRYPFDDRRAVWEICREIHG